MSRKPMTLRRLLLRAVLRTAVAAPAVALSLLWASAQMQAGVTAGPPAERPAAEGSPAQLVELHDCWTGAAPADMAGKFPGHVVATPAGGAPVWSARLVGPALEQAFGGADNGIVVHAFCR